MTSRIASTTSRTASMSELSEPDAIADAFSSEPSEPEVIADVIEVIADIIDDIADCIRV